VPYSNLCLVIGCSEVHSGVPHSLPGDVAMIPPNVQLQPRLSSSSSHLIIRRVAFVIEAVLLNDLNDDTGVASSSKFTWPIRCFRTACHRSVARPQVADGGKAFRYGR
jgi:hypothetical protein